MDANGFVDLLAANGGSSLVETSRNAGWTRMVACRWIQTSHDIEVPPCGDHFVEIVLGGRQRSVIRADGRRVGEVDAQPGDVTFLPAGHMVECVAECENADVLHLMLSPEMLASDLEEGVSHSASAPEPFTGHRNSRVVRLARLLEEELKSPAPLGALYADGLSQAFAVAFAEGFLSRRVAPQPPNGLSPRQLRIAIDYLETNISEEVRLADVAGAIGIGTFHFGRQFKRSTGKTPHQYLLERRIQRAQELLVSTEAPIAEIAVACGFHDQPHLSATMRRLAGATPGSVRRARS